MSRTRQKPQKTVYLGVFCDRLLNENDAIHAWMLSLVRHLRANTVLHARGVCKGIDALGNYVDPDVDVDYADDFDMFYVVYKSVGCQCVEEAAFRFELLKYCSLLDNVATTDCERWFVYSLGTMSFLLSLLVMAANVGGKVIVPYYEYQRINIDESHALRHYLCPVLIDESPESFCTRVLA